MTARCRLFAILLLALSSCNPAAKPAPRPSSLDPSIFNAERAMYEVQSFVAVGPRNAGTAGAEKAAAYLYNRLQALGVAATVDVFMAKSPEDFTVFRNVIGSIPGTGPGVIIVASHFDTKSGIEGFVGANDSGSSSGILLELARLFAQAPSLGPEIRFVFFDGEECMQSYGPNDGLQGSRHYASQLVAAGAAKEVLAVILLDMVGDKSLSITLPRNGAQELKVAVMAAAHEENVREKFSLHPFEVGDDHVPFLEAGMPAVDIIDFDFGSAPGLNDYWHTAQDTMDKLSAESLGLIGRVTIRGENDAVGRNKK
ncbi:MAG TPA: M28 family peptidase [Kiritimatiellia bacterium]